METKKQKITNKDINRNDVVKIKDSDIKKTIVEGNEVIDSLSKSDRKKVEQLIKVEKFSGPLPHPTILQQYDDIKKGFAERIIKMAEKEQNAIIEHDNAKLKYQARDSLLGSIFAFAILIVLFVGSMVLIMFDKKIAGFAAFVTAAATCAKIFFNKK